MGRFGGFLLFNGNFSRALCGHEFSKGALTYKKIKAHFLVLHLKVCTLIRHKNRGLNFMCEVDWRFLRSTCDSITSGVLIGSCQAFLSLTDFSINSVLLFLLCKYVFG